MKEKKTKKKNKKNKRKRKKMKMKNQKMKKKKTTTRLELNKNGYRIFFLILSQYLCHMTWNTGIPVRPSSSFVTRVLNVTCGTCNSRCMADPSSRSCLNLVLGRSSEYIRIQDNIIELIILLYFFSAWSFGFFIPATTANDLRIRRIFYPRFYPLHLFSYLNS